MANEITGRLNVLNYGEVKEDITKSQSDISDLKGNVAATNSELIDIRVGTDGTTYSNAGEAVRGQIGVLKDSLDDLIYSKKYTATKKGRVNIPFPISSGDIIEVTNNTENANEVGFRLTGGTENLQNTGVGAGKTKQIVSTVDADVISAYYNTTGEMIYVNLSKRVPILEKSVAQNTTDIAEVKQLKEDITEKTYSDAIYIENEKDFTTFSSSIADSNRYCTNSAITKEAYLTSVYSKTGLATEVTVVALTINDDLSVTVNHRYGTYTLDSDGKATINDATYKLSVGEYVACRFTGGFYYKPSANPRMYFVGPNLTTAESQGYQIAYHIECNEIKDTIDYIQELKGHSLRGRTYVAYGDSITAGYNLTGYVENKQFSNTDVQVYAKILSEQLGLRYYNYGYSSHGYSVTPNYTFSTLIEKHHTNADIVTVAMGTNDYGLANTYSIPFGELTDSEDGTFCGSVRKSFDKLMEYYPKAEIIILLPLPRANMSANGQGKTLYDYADTIKQIAGEYGFPVIDLLREGGVHHKSSAFMSEYSMDGLHWNEIFHRSYLAPIVRRAIENNFISN